MKHLKLGSVFMNPGSNGLFVSQGSSRTNEEEFNEDLHEHEQTVTNELVSGNSHEADGGKLYYSQYINKFTNSLKSTNLRFFHSEQHDTRFDYSEKAKLIRRKAFKRRGSLNSRLDYITGAKNFSDMNPEEKKERLRYLRFRMKVICLGIFYLVRLRNHFNLIQANRLLEKNLEVIMFDDEQTL